MNRPILPILVAGALLALAGCVGHAPQAQLVELALQQRLATPPAYARADAAAWDAVKQAYAAHRGQPMWLGNSEPRPELDRLRATLAAGADDGLDPRDYPLDEATRLQPESIGLLRKRYQPVAAAAADVQATFAAARFARDLQRGRVAPDSVARNWRGPARDDIGALVQRAASSGEIERVLREAAPADPQYERLRQSLVRLREIAARGGWPDVPERTKIEAGTAAPGFVAVRERLIASGYLAATNQSTMLDAEAQAAVKRFQRDHGLAETGEVFAETIAAMNVPVEARVRQLELNLERWRWMPEQLGDTRIVVNVPTFQLTAYEDGAPALAMRVVTGTTGTPTPVFSDTMESVVFSPYWNVPPSILRGEILPGVNKDPDYLSRKGMEVLRNGERVDAYSVDFRDPAVRVRQRPGAGNALGHVKFLLPNEHDVYLHDTPQDALFARPQRNFSHGCIRLEKPAELAQWVLRDHAEWTPDRIQSAMHSGSERHVRLAEPIPVYIIYQTAWVEDDGSLRFAKDIYRHDERQLALLDEVSSPVDASREQIAATD